MQRCCLVVGGDRLGAIPRLKEKLEIDEIVHWNGRYKRPPKTIPKKVNMVVIYRLCQSRYDVCRQKAG